MKRVAVLVSGRGTNLQALIDAVAEKRLDAEIVYVASNHGNVPALERAAKAGIPSGVFIAKKGERAAAQGAMADAIRAAKPDVIMLAGFDRIFEDVVFDKLEGIEILNIHPSLLPAFGGRGMLGDRVHQAVLESGVTESGCTVFRVARGDVDGGEIVVQRRVPVLPGDDLRTLADRVLAAEHVAIVEAVGIIPNDFRAKSPSTSSK